MKKLLFCIGVFAASMFVVAHADDTLSVSSFNLQEVSVTARVEQPTSTHQELSGEVLNRDNTGQNLPYLLQSTPSLIVTSDDGLGIGYT